jgi:hypothetical protein
VHRLQTARGIDDQLFVTATNVHSGRGRLFRNADLSPEVLLASACLRPMAPTRMDVSPKHEFHKACKLGLVKYTLRSKAIRMTCKPRLAMRRGFVFSHG